MIINIIFSINIIVTLMILLVGLVLTSKKTIKIVSIINEVIKNNKDTTAKKRAQKKYKLMELLQLIINKIITNKFLLLIKAASYQLLQVKPYSYIRKLKEYLIKYFIIRYDNKEEAEIYCINFLIKIVSTIMFSNVLGSCIVIYMQKDAKGDLGIILYIVIKALTLTLLYLEIDSLKQQKREKIRVIKTELPKFILNLTMLCNSGMTLIEAYLKAIRNKNGYFYKEMKSIIEKVEDGETFIIAAKETSRKLKIQDISTFFRILTQAQKHGSSDYLKQLEDMRMSLQYKKLRNSKNKSTVADAKMLLPLSLIFIGIMIIVIVPIFMSIF